MSPSQLAILLGLIIGAPIIAILAWWGIKHGSGGNT